MKVLFVHERFGAWGGAEANILLCGRELKRRGHQVGLLHGTPTGKGEVTWGDTFTPLYRLGAQNNGVELAAAVDSFGPDVVYVHKMSDMKIIEALATGPAPVVRMVHDHDLYCMRSYKYNPLTREVCQRAVSPYCVFPCGGCVGKNPGGLWPFRWVSYRAKKKEIRLNQRFARLVVASQYMREELVRNGFEEEKIRILAPVPQGLKVEKGSTFSERNIIIYAGQIIRGKGVDVLLEALAKVELPFECLIFGEGNHLPHCRALCQKLKLEDRVRFMGFIPQQNLAEYYREASVAVLSSVWPEPFGAVGLEAMSYGVPVVAFDVGGIREWLISAYNGFLVRWMDRDEFAARIQQLLKNKSLARQMGARGQRFIEQKFNFNDYINGLENLFQEVVTGERERMAA